MSAILTVTLVNLETGTFGPVISGAEDDIAPLLTSPYVLGAFDAATQRLNVVTGDIEPLPVRSPMVHELRQARNELLDAWRWTVMPDSPLTEASQAEWLGWLRAVQACLRDINPTATADFEFPARPPLLYPDEAAV